MPPTNQPIHAAMTVALCFGSRNMVLINARVEGASAALAAISVSGLVEKAATTEAMPNAAAPIISNRLRPIRSPRVPMVTRKPATMKP